MSISADVHPVDQVLPTPRLLALGLQHVLVMYAGAVAVPLSTFSPKPELAHLLASSEAVVVLTQTRLLARRFGEDVEALHPELPSLRTVAVLGEPSWDELLATS